MIMAENLLNTYKWLSNEFFEKVLHSEYGDSTIEVKCFQVEPACKAGENYCSQMIRAKIDYKINTNNNRTIKFVIKAPLSADGVDDILEKFHVFRREYTVFHSILPDVHRMLKQIGDISSLGPHIYLASDDPKCFVFEDLCQSSYRNVDRRQCFDFDHMKLIVTKLAKWHAGTAVMGEMNISSMSSHRIPNVCEEVDDFHKVWTSTLENCANAIKLWPGFEKIAEKLYKLKAVTVKRNSAVFTTNELGFNVLSHGDLWGNNIMFKYNNRNEPIDAVFVDFAVGFWGSPALDLGYLFYSSSDETVREIEWDRLLIIYHEELIRILKLLKYPKTLPTLTDIHIEMLNKSFYAVSVAIFLVAIRLSDDTKYANMSGLLDDTEGAIDFRAKIFNHPEYKKIMEYLLDYFNRKGLIN